MPNTIKIKSSGTPSATPTSLEYGEVAINYADGKLFYKNPVNQIVAFATGGSANVSDGDKGDIVVSNGGSTWSLDTGVVSSFARTLLDDADAAAARATLGAAASSHTHTSASITDFSSAVAAASPEEVVEYLTAGSFPSTGSASLLYRATDSARLYAWVGSQYAEVGPSSVGVGLSADSLLRGLFVPPAPTSLAATAGNAQVALSWSAPSVIAQAPITDYVVQASSNSGSTWSTVSRTASTTASQIVTGLTNGTAYVFRVAAVNAVGTGSYTGQSSSVTPIAGNVVTAITGLQAWYDASDASTLFDATSGGSLVAADGAVARWEDKSGNARHFTQSTSGNRPLRKTGIQNSLAVLRFDGSNDFMSVPSSTAIFKFLHDGDSTVFVVLKPGVVANPDALYWILGNSTDSGSTDEQTGYYLRYDDRTSARADLDDSLVHVVLNGGSPRFVGVAKSALPSNTFSLATVRDDPGNATIASRSQVRRNGGSAITQVTSDTNGATALPTGNATQNMFVGATPGATLSWPLNGDIAEIIMYDSALSDTDRSAVESYLRAKWGIS
jgi:hypothetical protein